MLEIILRYTFLAISLSPTSTYKTYRIHREAITEADGFTTHQDDVFPQRHAFNGSCNCIDLDSAWVTTYCRLFYFAIDSNLTSGTVETETGMRRETMQGVETERSKSGRWERMEVGEGKLRVSLQIRAYKQIQTASSH